MKQYKTTIISLIVIAVVITAFFIVSAVLDKQESNAPAEPTAEETKTVSVFGFDNTSDLAAYECNIVDEIKLERNSSGEWVCPTYADLALNESGVATALNSLKQCYATVVYEGEITDEIIKSYDISRTQYVKLTFKDGTVKTLRFGMQKPGSASYFAVVEEANKVYLINSTYKSAVVLTKENLLHTQIFSFNDEGKIKYIEVYKSGERFIYLSGKMEAEDTRTWKMEYPLNRPGADSHIEEVLTSALNLTTLEYIEGDCENLAQYGLDNPVYLLRIADNKGTQTLSVGNKVPDGDAYYCIFGGENNVFTIDLSSITFIDDSALKYMDTAIFDRMYTELKSINVNINCGDIKESFVMGFDIWEDGEQLYFNGTALPDSNDVIRPFRRINTALYLIDLVGLEDEPETKGELLISVEYKTSSGETILVEGFRRDDTTMSLYENGVYCGGYDHIRQITGNNDSYGIVGALENFRTISGMN